MSVAPAGRFLSCAAFRPVSGAPFEGWPHGAALRVAVSATPRPVARALAWRPLCG